MPNISQAVHKLQHVSWVPLGKHNVGKESPPTPPPPPPHTPLTQKPPFGL